MFSFSIDFIYWGRVCTNSMTGRGPTLSKDAIIYANTAGYQARDVKIVPTAVMFGVTY